MNSIVPVLLIGLGGFLIGGVVSLWKKSLPAAVVVGVFSAACIVGGLLWLIGES